MLRGTAVTALAALGVGLGAVPAEAKPNDPCATARAIFKANVDRARGFLVEADRLGDAGDPAGADAAQAEADNLMAVAEGALGDVQGSC